MNAPSNALEAGENGIVQVEGRVGQLRLQDEHCRRRLTWTEPPSRSWHVSAASPRTRRMVNWAKTAWSVVWRLPMSAWCPRPRRTAAPSHRCGASAREEGTGRSGTKPLMLQVQPAGKKMMDAPVGSALAGYGGRPGGTRSEQRKRPLTREDTASPVTR